MFVLFAVSLASTNSLVTPTAARPTKSARPVAFSSVTTTTTEESVSRSGDEIGLSVECSGPVKAYGARLTGIQKPNCGIFAEIGRTLAATTEIALGRVGGGLRRQRCIATAWRSVTGRGYPETMKFMKTLIRFWSNFEETRRF